MEGLNLLMTKIKQVGFSNENLLIGMEATGHYWMTLYHEYAEQFSDIFGAASRALLSLYPTAEDIKKIDIRKLTRILKESSKGHMGRKQANRLKNAAKNSFSLSGSNLSFAMEIKFLFSG